MKSAEEFDDFIKSRFSNHDDFPFEEDKWARMEEMIIRDETKRRRRKYFGFYLGGFLTALLLSIPLYLMKNDRKTTEKSKNKTEVNPGKKITQQATNQKSISEIN